MILPKSMTHGTVKHCGVPPPIKDLSKDISAVSPEIPGLCTMRKKKRNHLRCLAQLGRASGLGPEGHRFKSYNADTV